MLTFAEVCDRLRLAPKTVRNLITSGELEAIRTHDAPNAPYRVSEEALDDYIKRRKVVPDREAS